MRLGPDQFLSVLTRRKWSATTAFILFGAGIVALGIMATPRYDAYALLLVGERLADRRATDLTEKQAEDNILSLTLIAKTDDVLTQAAEAIGWERLFPNGGASTLDKVSEGLLKLRARLGVGTDKHPTGADKPQAEPIEAPRAVDPPPPAAGEAPRTPHADEVTGATPTAGTATAPRALQTPALLTTLQRGVQVRAETKASLIRIAFGHSDPAVAAEFTNALAEALITRQAELWSRPGALDFFQIQRKRFEEEVGETSAAFSAFIASNSTYSITEQRELLLKRASDIATALAATRASQAERDGQKQALADQLQRLKPVAANPFVSSLVDALGGSERRALGPRSKAVRAPPPATEPPLLLVKVYQDGMAQLLKINSELAGFNLMAEAQERELKRVDAELATLIGKEAEFDRLKKAVAMASYNAEIYGKRLFEEQVNADLAKARMAGLRLVQAAFVPVTPAFPNVAMIGAGALVVGFMAALAMATLVEWRAVARKRAATRGATFSGPGAYTHETPYGEPPYRASVSIRLSNLDERRAPRIAHD